jgi:hypothetical protein
MSHANEYSLNITTIPPDSQIKVMNIGPKYKYGMKLPPGKYDILVLKKNYNSKRQWIEIKDQNVYLSVVLSLVDELLWGKVKSSDKISEYEKYLEEYPNGQFAKQARQKTRSFDLG